jgi:C4-type Zn-finger protein
MIKGAINFEINISCPHCEEYFDLIAHDDNNEGFWTMKFREWISNKPDADKCKEEAECPACCKTVYIDGLEY